MVEELSAYLLDLIQEVCHVSGGLFSLPGLFWGGRDSHRIFNFGRTHLSLTCENSEPMWSSSVQDYNIY